MLDKKRILSKKKDLNRRSTDNTMAKNKQDKKTNKFLLNTTKNTKDCATQTQQTSMSKLLTVVISVILRSTFKCI
jgi:hypothetical protein